MKFALALIFALFAVASASPTGVVDISLEDIGIDVDIEDGVHTGEYSFTDPEGATHFVKYVADTDGFRVIESNVVPATLDNVRADGNQGSFTSIESDED
ncbi:unnamed protein product [Meganyctiphanes norvegica]|uniref:Cuticle protein n=1 Tax=Meganyctiphanes norvegica TaxID=48144 RepID=A0AAV2SPD4_MEGNR